MRHSDLWPQGLDFHATEQININSVCKRNSRPKSLPFSSKTDLCVFGQLQLNHPEGFVPVARWTTYCCLLFVLILSLKKNISDCDSGRFSSTTHGSHPAVLVINHWRMRCCFHWGKPQILHTRTLTTFHFPAEPPSLLFFSPPSFLPCAFLARPPGFNQNTMSGGHIWLLQYFCLQSCEERALVEDGLVLLFLSGTDSR